MYAEMLSILMGVDPAEADRQVWDMIAACKEQGKREGTDRLPANFGDLMIRAATLGEPKSKRIVEKARREGATDPDIREWWNLSDLERRMVLWSEDLFRYATFLHAMETDGLSPEEAAHRVHMMFPHYGDPDDTSKLPGENRPLPHELRGRVDAYRVAQGAHLVADQVKTFPSYNAFVRDSIRKGII